MKLIIQIPCLNESETLGIALNALPREVPGFDMVEWLIVDDGSTDNTIEVAKAHGVDHVIRHPVNRGLAVAFMTGIEACLRLGADVIVNTDADNQYNADDIPLLTAPVVQGSADMVIGARPIDETEHFSWVKKKLQRLGSWAVRKASGTSVADAPSGFRAISRETAFRLNVFSPYTYTLETIIQAGASNLRVLSVPIKTNADLRPSRLVKSISSYVRRSLGTIFRVFVIYHPARLFFYSASALLLVGMAATARFLIAYFSNEGAGHVQSLVLASTCIILGALLFAASFLAEQNSANRKMLERLQVAILKLQMQSSVSTKDEHNS